MARLTDIDPSPDLLRRAAAGDTAAQAAVYGELAGPVFGLVRRLIGDRHAAEDVFQDTLLQVFRSLPAFRGEAPFGAWVRRIAVSRCLMHLRSPWQRLRSTLHDITEDPPGDADAAPRAPAMALADAAAPDVAARVDLERALARLGPTARAVLWLHDVEGYTHDEIAAAFGRTASFSKSQLSRAHAALRPLLDGGAARGGDRPLPRPAT